MTTSGGRNYAIRDVGAIFVAEPFLFLLACLVYFMTLGWVLQDKGLFQVFWQNTPVFSGCFFGLFWCIWVMVCQFLLDLRVERNAIPGYSRRWTTVLLALVPVTNLLFLTVRVVTEDRETGVGFFELALALGGAVLATTIFVLIERFGPSLQPNPIPPPPPVSATSRSQTVRALLWPLEALFWGHSISGGIFLFCCFLAYLGLYFREPNWANDSAKVLGDNPVAVFGIWFLLGSYLSLFEQVGKASRQRPPDFIHYMRAELVVALLLMLLVGSFSTDYLKQRSVTEDGWRNLVRTAAFFGLALYAVDRFWVVLFHFPAGATPDSIAEWQTYVCRLLRRAGFFGGLLLVAAVLVGLDPSSWCGRFFGWEFSNNTVMVLGFFLAALSVILGVWISPNRPLATRSGLGRLLDSFDRNIEVLFASGPAGVQSAWLRPRTVFFTYAIIYCVYIFLNHLVDAADNSRILQLPASSSLFMIFAGFVLALGWLNCFYPQTKFLFFLVPFVIYMAVFASQRYPHRLQALEALEYYRRDAIVHRDKDTPAEKLFDGRTMPDLFHYDKMPDPARPKPLLGDEQVLQKWLGKQKNKRPPLVIVTTSGGASGSGIFTLKILTALEEHHPGFAKKIRLMTGASGGMLGSAYFRSRLPALEGQAEAFRKSEFQRMNGRLESDFLSPVAQEWIFKDLPMSFCPWSYSNDRGERLERAWKKYLDGALDLNFKAMADQEREGDFPSIVFTPVLAEDGRQLLISTLDLDRLAQPKRLDINPDEAINRYSAIEFFRVFPDAFDRLPLSAAVRLNATFAWLSPIVTLPTVPPRTVVDAGYLDNHGIFIAAKWVLGNKKWLEENVSKVIFLNIRVWDDYFLDGEAEQVPPLGSPEIAKWRREKNDYRWSAPLLSLAEFAGPLSSMDTIREYGMKYRNDGFFEALRKALPAGGDFLGVEQITVVGDEFDLPLNWSIAPKRVEKMTRMIDEAMELARDPKRRIVPTRSLVDFNGQQIRTLLKEIGGK